jgi:hypothetical protein
MLDIFGSHQDCSHVRRKSFSALNFLAKQAAAFFFRSPSRIVTHCAALDEDACDRVIIAR